MDTFDAVQYSVKKGHAEFVRELITKTLSKSKLVFSNIEMNFKIIENEDASVLEWHYRNLKSTAAEEN